MPNKTTRDDAETAFGGATQRTREVAARMADAAGNIGAAIDARRSTAADGLDAAASALGNRAATLPGGTTVRNAARATADGLSTGADYVRSRDARGMAADLDKLVRRNPGLVLVAVAAFGFLLVRALSRERE